MAEAKDAPLPLEGGEKFAFAWETGKTKPQSEGEAARGLFEDLDSEWVDDFVSESEDPKGSSKKPAAKKREDEDESEGEEAESSESEESDSESADDEEGADEDGDQDSADDADEESEDDEEADESDEDEDSEDGDDADLIEVTLPGGEKIKVTREEAAAGYSRTQDYTRKRQRDANEHAEAMRGVREQRETYDRRLEQLEKVLTSLGPKKPDAALRQSNPGEYAAQLQDYNDFQERIADVKDARGEISAERRAELTQWRNERIVEARQKLEEAKPEWKKDPKLAAAALQGLGQFLTSEFEHPFTSEELDGVADYRLVLLAHEVMEHRKALAESKGRIKDRRGKTGKVLKAGSSQGKTGKGAKAKKGDRARRELETRLARTGSLHDAARLIEMDLD
ncbi:MAG: hypothetical protein AB7R40_23325 [Nitrospiraceae bacterium]